MDDEKLVRLLRKKKEEALEALVEKYSAYVSTVARNVAGGTLGNSDIEEITADVFITVWKKSSELCADTSRSHCKKHFNRPLAKTSLYSADR